MADRVAYKILLAAEAVQLQREGVFRGSAADIADGYIHLSCADQLAGTLDRYFGGVGGVMLAAVELSRLGDAVRWERSRGGQLFPHIYGLLPISAVVSVVPLERNSEGRILL